MVLNTIKKTLNRLTMKVYIILATLFLIACSRDACDSVDYKFSTKDKNRSIEIKVIDYGATTRRFYEIVCYENERIHESRRIEVPPGIPTIKEIWNSKIEVIISQDTLIF